VVAPKRIARTNELLRRRDALKRTRQLWVAGLVIWGVVVGWVAFGVVNAITDDVDVRLTWVVVWLIPVGILAAGWLLTQRRLRACETAMIEVARSH
jgi:uncharacterized membrane protein YhaH (DUF805 family)